MSIFTGKQHKGAMREHREAKRREAVERNARNMSVLTVCYHATSLPFDEHLSRCGGAR